MISERLKQVILGQLKLKDFDLTGQTLAYQVPGWDSLNHVIILAAVEKEYGIVFNITEVLRLKNLGDLQSLVDGLSDRSRELLFRVAESPGVPIERHMEEMRCSFAEAQHILHDITSAGLFAVKQSGGFEMRDPLTASALTGLRVTTDKPKNDTND